MKSTIDTKKASLKEKDFWSDLPGHVKAGIERGQKQAAEGKLTPNDEAMMKYAKYL